MNETPDPETRAPRSDEVLSTLENEIIAGTLSPGPRISEVEIATRLAVGRAPVREALRTLESRRLLQRVPYAGMRVIELSEKDVRELLGLREVLEGLAARGAADSIDEVGAARLTGALDDEKALVADGVGAVFRKGSSDNGFHETIVKLSGNSWLEAMLLEDLYSLLRTFRFRAAKAASRLNSAHEEHRNIARAILDSNANKAEALMREHVKMSLANLFEKSENSR